MTDARTKGLEIFGGVYGDKAVTGLKAYMETEDFGVDCARWATDFAFGTVWSRDGIERKTRSAAVLGMLIALRQTDEIRYHTVMGLANGLTKREIEEILLSSVPYCGLPASNIARAAMREGFAQVEAAKKAE